MLCQKIDDYVKKLFLILIVYVDTNSGFEYIKLNFTLEIAYIFKLIMVGQINFL